MKFSLQQALRNLDIEIKPFGYTGHSDLEGPGRDEVRGYSTDRWLAINPDERWPVLVTFHEMTHILLGHTVLHEKFGSTGIIPAGQRPKPEDIMYMAFKDLHHDLHEAECHATAILAAQLTGIPFDLGAELMHLGGYTQGRTIPQEVMARARKTAEKIAAAGKVDQRSLSGRQGWVAA